MWGSTSRLVRIAPPVETTEFNSLDLPRSVMTVRCLPNGEVSYVPSFQVTSSGDEREAVGQ